MLGFRLNKLGAAMRGNKPIVDFRFDDPTRSLDSRITFSRASSATYFDSTGTLQTAGSGVARAHAYQDHDPSTLTPLGFLIEEQRTNLLLQSADFATTWTLAGTGTPSVTVNSATSPAGTLTADTISGAQTTSNRVQQTVTVANSTTYVLSFFVKNLTAVTSKFHIANTSSGTTNSETVINWTGATLTSFTNSGTTSAVAVALLNGWYRVYFAFTTNGADAGTSTVRFYPNEAAGDATNKAVYLWGAMLEAGAFPTSYIATTTAAATRLADSALIDGTNFSSFWNATEGTLIAEAADVSDAAHISSQPRVVSANNGTTNNYIDINRLVSSQQVRAVVNDGGVNQFNSLATAWAANSFKKIANAYKVNDFAACLGGGTVATEASGTVPTVDRMRIGGLTPGGSQWTGWIKRVSYYRTRLSNTTLQGITA